MTTNTNRLFALVLSGALCAGLGACGEDAAPQPDAPDGDVATATQDADALMAAYDRGLDFLVSRSENGVWKAQGHPHAGFTAMAVTNLIERPGGAREQDRETIDAALSFLAGSLDDKGSVREAYRPNYMTAALIMALSASGDPAFQPQVQKAAGFIRTLQRLDEQNPTYGGVGYGSDDTRSDLSNTQYALASLRAAGIPEDDPVFQRAVVFLSRTQNLKENETAGEPTEWVDKETGTKVVRSNDGGANYYPGNSKGGWDTRPDGVGVLRSYGSMTFALLRCYHLAGVEADDPRVKAAVGWIADNWTLDENPGMPADLRKNGLYYYYATMGKTLPLAGIDEIPRDEGPAIDWRAALSARLLDVQNEDGSWANTDDRWMEGDPVLATSYALTALQGCVR